MKSNRQFTARLAFIELLIFIWTNLLLLGYVFVVPVFEMISQDFRMEYPELTLGVFALSRGLNGCLLLLPVIAVVPTGLVAMVSARNANVGTKVAMAVIAVLAIVTVLTVGGLGIEYAMIMPFVDA